ncbi:GH1 family beta-glucosidase [Crossiella sp. SN42]|uniref:GH1 family beta-glucosidase n=1 Tax=Crossiella sp. SN42 TaxID=2944808 RepID=UPI00207C2C53|nr:GH1 family beta-glucosidase [Crossiella sp. SN42]MCO1578841.1 GH1 family beta-glucosidase [Crossiella sp. SN42]
MTFPPGFVWGTATSAFQIEGATTVDGRGPSIWDTFAATPGKVEGGDTGEPACEHYTRYPEDIALMKRLGVSSYRFSLAWPRIQPTGTGPAEPRGLAFYDRLVDALLEAGIEPMVTLYHWDLPQALQDKGGWVNRDTVDHFTEYARIAHAHLGDRVKQWTTLNEPFCPAYLGYGIGIHAPGIVDPASALVAAHHLLLAHGRAMTAMRAQARPGQQFSLVLNFSTARVAVADEAHLAAARKVEGLSGRLFLEPVLRGVYPADVLSEVAHLNALAPAIREGDLAEIAAPIDWLGVNYYNPTRVAPAADPLYETPGALPGLRGVEILPPEGPLTHTGWEQEAAALTDLLRWLAEQAPGMPLLVTENGSAFPDEVSPDGQVHDPERTAYLLAHLRAVHAAIQAGVDVRGYLAWSLLDNFEWAFGYDKRFGLVHVDFATQARTFKDSAHAYAKVVAANAVAPE